MTDDPIFLVAALAALGVLGVLLLGIGSFGKGATSTAATPTS